MADDAGRKIDEMIAGLGDWRGEVLAAARKAIRAAEPDIVEEWKWMGSPTWSCDGLVAVGDAHKAKVKLTFAHGAGIEDPKGLFNNGFGGNARRAIDIAEGDSPDWAALTELTRAAITWNRQKLKKNKS